jgi:hypothetical protein
MTVSYEEAAEIIRRRARGQDRPRAPDSGGISRPGAGTFTAWLPGGGRGPACVLPGRPCPADRAGRVGRKCHAERDDALAGRGSVAIGLGNQSRPSASASQNAIS